LWNIEAVIASNLLFLLALAIPLQKWDVNHSTIAFRIPILGGMSEVEGKFTDFTLDVVFDQEHLENSEVKAVIKAASIDTGIAERDKDLRSANFFDVAKYPDITFESTLIEKTPAGYIAHGDFTMHGVTHPVSLPFTLTGTKRDTTANTIIAGFAAQITLNRQDYGIAWKHSADPVFVGDDVQVQIRVITKKNPIPPPPSQ
jgi:polyisoprenoid-binding protein YceI